MASVLLRNGDLNTHNQTGEQLYENTTRRQQSASQREFWYLSLRILSFGYMKNKYIVLLKAPSMGYFIMTVLANKNIFTEAMVFIKSWHLVADLKYYWITFLNTKLQLCEECQRAIWKTIYHAQQYGEAVWEPGRILHFWPEHGNHRRFFWWSQQLQKPIFGE